MKKSKYTGVSWNKRHRRWGAVVYHNNKRVYYHNCETEIEAVKQRDMFIIKNRLDKPLQIIKPKRNE